MRRYHGANLEAGVGPISWAATPTLARAPGALNP